jgi:hypothetical protein
MSQPSFAFLTVFGAVVAMHDPTGLALFVDPCSALPTGELVVRGALIVAPGVPLLYEMDAVLVESVYDDYRREHHGAEALTFMLHHGQAFPRADVLGRRVSTGAAVELFLKQLDLGAGLHIFAYRALDRPALGRLEAAVWARPGSRGWVRASVDGERIPAWLRRSIPCWDVGIGALTAPPADLFAASSG